MRGEKGNMLLGKEGKELNNVLQQTEPSTKQHSPPIDSLNLSDFISIEEWNKKINQEFNSIYQDLCRRNSNTTTTTSTTNSLQPSQIKVGERGSFSSKNSGKEVAKTTSSSTSSVSGTVTTTTTTSNSNTSTFSSTSPSIAPAPGAKTKCHNSAKGQISEEKVKEEKKKEQGEEEEESLQMNMAIGTLGEESRNFNRSPQPWQRWPCNQSNKSRPLGDDCKGGSVTFSTNSDQKSTREEKTLLHPIKLTDSQGSNVFNAASSNNLTSIKVAPPPVPPKPNIMMMKSHPEPRAIQSIGQSQSIPSVIITDVTNKCKIEKIDTIEKTEQLFDENFNQIYNEAVNLANSPSTGRKGNLLE